MDFLLVVALIALVGLCVAFPPFGRLVLQLGSGMFRAMFAGGNKPGHDQVSSRAAGTSSSGGRDEMAEAPMDVYIQFLDSSGWRTCQTMSARNNGATINIAMQEAQRAYPSCRIRAVDDKGRVIDMI